MTHEGVGRDESRIEVRDDLPPGTAIYHDPNVYVCSLCWPSAVEIAEFGVDAGGGLCLFENEGRFGLMEQPGHTDDHVVLWFPSKPLPEPPDGPWTEDGNYVDPEDKARYDAWLDLCDKVYDALKMDPQSGRWFVEQCEAAGYGDTGREPDLPILGQWLVGYCGLIVRRWEEAVARGEKWPGVIKQPVPEET